jgi:hypothetical protein
MTPVCTFGERQKSDTAMTMKKKEKDRQVVKVQSLTDYIKKIIIAAKALFTHLTPKKTKVTASASMTAVSLESFCVLRDHTLYC